MASEYNGTTAFLQGQASSALIQAQTNAGRIWGLQNVNANTRDPRFAVSLDAPDIGPPPSFGELFGADSTDGTIAWLGGQAEEWIAKYFPTINSGFKNQPEETLLEIIAGVKPYGIDSTILELVWHKARDRAQRTVDSEIRTMEAGFSARGFSLPPGAMVAATIELRDRATSAVLDVNRDQAIKDADIKVEMFKMAMQIATQMKTAIMQSLADFYRMWISVPDKDLEKARIRAQAQSALYSALASYYNVEIRFEELKLQAARSSAEVDLGVDRLAVAKQGNYMGVAGPLATAVNAFASTSGSAAQAGGSLTAQIEAV